MPIPEKRTLEDLATKPQDQEQRELAVDFVSGLLCWLPEERLDSFEVFSHLWLYRALEQNGHIVHTDQNPNSGNNESP